MIRSELIYTMELFKQELSKLHSTIGEPISQNIIENLLKMRSFIETEKGGFDYHVYIASFSEKSDSLTQWKFYGDNTGGYEIGVYPKLTNYDKSSYLITEKIGLKFFKIGIQYQQTGINS